MKLRSILFSILFGLCSQLKADPQEVRMAVIDFPPFTMITNNKPHGQGVEIVRELLRRAQFKFNEAAVPLARTAAMSETDVAVFLVFTRNADRESKYQWIGSIFEDKYCFATLKTNPAVTTLEEAKAVKKIGVVSGGATETYLKGLGLTNIEGATDTSGNARKLFAGRLDAWFMAETAVYNAVKKEGLDRNNVVCSGEFSRPKYWIASSLKMPLDQHKKLVEIFKQMEKEGYITKMLAEVK